MSNLKVKVNEPLSRHSFSFTLSAESKRQAIDRIDVEEFINIPSRFLDRVEDMFSICHELSHCLSYRRMSKSRRRYYLRSSRLRKGRNYLISVYLDEEIKAWVNSFDCIKPEYYGALIRFARLKFLTYLRDYKYCRSYMYWTKKFDKALVWRLR